MSILSLKETGTGFFEDLSDLVTDILAGNGPPYPEFVPLTPKLERGKAFKVFPYAFRVVDSTLAGNLPFVGSAAVGLGQGGGPNAPFRKLKLNLNPQSINLDETYAVNITPTEGGVVRENKGLILRDLVITGTTGINPDRGTQGLTEGVESGYEAIHRLVNFFRSYGEKMKTDPSFRSTKQLVFINRKDSEELIVEPVRISRKKSVPRSTLYEYTMVFKVVGPLQQTFPFPPWLQDIFNGLENFGNIINDVYYKLQKAKGILMASENFLKNIQADIVSTLLEPLKQTTSFMQAVGNFQQTILDIKPNLFNDIKSEGGAQYKQLQQATNKADLNKFFQKAFWDKYTNDETENKTNKGKVQLSSTDNLGSFMEEQAETSSVEETVDQMLSQPLENILTPAQQQEMLEELQKNQKIQKDQIDDLISVIENLAFLVAQNANLSDETIEEFIEGDVINIQVSPNKVPTQKEIDILAALEDAKISLQYIQSSPELFAEDPTDKEIQAEEAFGNNIDVVQGASVKTIILDKGQTVVDLATTYLGDALKWIDIVQLNNLLPPFTTDDETSTLKNVAKPGDSVLIPLQSAAAAPNNQVVEQLPINENLNALEQQLGIDIALDVNGDYIVANNDFKLIAGAENALQALKNAFQTTPGELRYHPSYGFQLDIGEKISDITPTDVFDAIFNTVLSDDRFEDIKNLQINFSNNIITTIMKVVPKGGNLPVPLIIRT